MKHTVGPWQVVKPPGNTTPDLFIFGLKKEWIASVRRYDVHTQEANARLISAAPELLEACIKAYEAIDAILDFQERGLMVHGWHLNGDSEPFDNFIDENMVGNELELLYKAIQKVKFGGDLDETRT
jgi:hypothetical protein